MITSVECPQHSVVSYSVCSWRGPVRISSQRQQERQYETPNSYLGDSRLSGSGQLGTLRAGSPASTVHLCGPDDGTCPIALLSSYPIRLYWVLLANTATYALVGLVVETLRQRLRHAK